MTTKCFPEGMHPRKYGFFQFQLLYFSFAAVRRDPGCMGLINDQVSLILPAQLNYLPERRKVAIHGINTFYCHINDSLRDLQTRFKMLQIIMLKRISTRRRKSHTVMY